MIDLKAVAADLAQARQARIEAELAGCEVEELTEELRRSHPGVLWPQTRRASAGPHLFVFST